MQPQLAKTSGTERLAIAPAHSNQSPLGCELYKGNTFNNTLLTRLSERSRRVASSLEAARNRGRPYPYSLDSIPTIPTRSFLSPALCALPDRLLVQPCSTARFDQRTSASRLRRGQSRVSSRGVRSCACIGSLFSHPDLSPKGPQC